MTAAGPVAGVAAARDARRSPAALLRRDLVVEMLRGPMLLAAAGAVANFLNLIMNLALARLLKPSEYGAVVVQTNIYMVLAVVGTAVLTAVVHRDLSQTDRTRRERRNWITRLRQVMRFSAAGAVVVALALCRPVAALLAYPHPFAIAEAAIGAALWVSVCVERGLLQARSNYPGLARNMVFETIFRVACIIAAASVGLGVNGAGLGLSVGALVATVAARRTVALTPPVPSPPAAAPLVDGDEVAVGSPPAGGPLPAVAPAAPAAPRRTRDALLADTSVALAALVPLALLQNIDVVIVGWRNPDGAGSYAAISTACKIPVFIGLAVANYLLAEAARRRREGRPAGRALAMALGIVVAPGLLLALTGAVAGHLLVSVLFGPKLATDAAALPVLALATTALSVTLLFASYLLGAGTRRIVWVLAVCTPLSVVILVLADGRIMLTATALLVSQAFTAAMAGSLVLRLHRDARRADDDRRGTDRQDTVPLGPGGQGPDRTGPDRTGPDRTGPDRRDRGRNQAGILAGRSRG
ncbi:oligosaccharide flippase family protein [Frankia sp. AgB32]|uniref:oligosaccharide flippase family protein n=1 Tax=Frankia sp. AgB32 TaxID=631119 RepID=UPI00200C9A28|nr:oligosaccharide flippase family protein [Frankia sp. AgB32]MCK9897331.1 oligosaccharide flippase family protein [Frankia sp. AgB32]